MRRNYIFFTFFLICTACQKHKSANNTKQERISVTKNENSDENSDQNSISFNNKVCIIKNDENKCELESVGFRKLIQLSNSGLMPESILNVREISDIYQLSVEQINCIKNTYCKE